MTTMHIRAILENGQLRLLDPLNFPEGQLVMLQVEVIDEREALKLALGDNVQWGDLSLPDDEIDEELLLAEVREAFSGDKPLSEIIIEDRGEL
jgi:predicted DNA-binding antitoxin AbrB/MazE fold protein